ncbi:MAG: 16S rRNA (uracil(1498)-N(3))-methyltransferase [Gammaproteobacteria bacterium]|nr:16S rRNA (uracil(1498)-N(3))-methyltransferase [Gammaproteobacteria bacterium]
MRLSRIHTTQPLIPNQMITLEPTASSHLIRVLRLRPGAELVLFNGDGYNYRAQLEIATKKGATIQVLTRSELEPEADLEIHLYISISKGERMDFAIQKSVEMGVSEITPLFSQRGVVNLKGERLEKRQKHWQQVMIAACEQSGRCRLPTMHNAIVIEQLFETPPAGIKLTLNHRADICLPDLDPQGNSFNILIGPEGGLSEAEILAAQNSSFCGVRLGPRVLRTETAPLAAIAAIQTLWGDYR